MTTTDLRAWAPCALPDTSPMQGRFVRLVALDAARHGADLWRAFGGTANTSFWDYLPEGPFSAEADFRATLDAIEKRPDWISFAILDAASGRALGAANYMRMDPANGVGEVGFVAFGEGLARQPGATEAMLLMGSRLFDELGYRRYEWKCNALNEPSRRAAARLGFTYEGTFRQHLVVKGRNRDTAWFSILDSEWPKIRAGLERWLDASNFDGEGRQVRSLTECRDELMASDSHMHADHEHGDHDHGSHDHAGHTHTGHGHGNHSHAGHSHDHGHAPAVEAGNKNRVLLAAALTTVFMVAEALGGLLSGSLALLADAGHMLTDAVALSFAYVAYRASERPGTKRMTYGFDRLKILVAYTNGLAILAIALWIVVEAVERVLSPEPVLGGSMMVIAVLGLVVNLGCFAILHGGDRESLNMRGALLHVMGDLLGSIGAIIAAGIILLTGWTLADPILSVVVSVILLRSAWSLLKESGLILMEGAPGEMNRDAIEADLSAHIGGAADIHHMHVWSLDDRQKMATLHARMKEGTGPDALTMAIKKRLRDVHGIDHATIQVEESPLCLDRREPDGHVHEHAA